MHKKIKLIKEHADCFFMAFNETHIRISLLEVLLACLLFAGLSALLYLSSGHLHALCP